MADFKIGDRVIHIKSQQEAVVVEVFPEQGGMQLYKIFVSGKDVMCPEQHLMPKVDISDEFEKCKQGLFGTNDHFVLTNTTFKISNQSTNSIATMMASKTDFKPYQYIPLLKFLYSNNKRLLVADEVGLGKTIEAGHILMELKARHELRNALIICPNSLLDKWHDELQSRFDLNFSVYGVGMGLQFINDLKQRQDSLYGIINYEKIRNKNLVKYLENHPVTFDFIICDEAHKMRNHTTATHNGAKLLINKAKADLFLTATPIMNSEENLFWLLNLLDEQDYDNPYLFSNALKENAPFILALSQLSETKMPLKKIIQELGETEIVSSYTVGDVLYEKTQTINEKFASVPIYQRIIANSNEKDNLELRIQMQSDISSLNVINGIFTRNRKRDVLYEAPQAQREAKPCYIPFTPEERKVYDEKLAEYRNRYTYIDADGELRWNEGRMLGYMTLERQLSSSLYAYIEGPTRAADREDAKFNALLQVYNEVVSSHHKKMIVFAVFNHTIDYLQIRFAKYGVKTVVINGKLNSQQRKQELEKFRDQEENSVLIASEVGSEGLDMQFCDALVNYDLPWNPMVVEQRIGRIDRLGQKSPIINIYNMVMQDTIHEKIYYRLLDRIHIFTSCIGDLEAILDSDFVPGKTLQEALDELERDFYRLDLTDEQKAAQAEQLQMALIREKNHLDEVSEKLTDTLTNDIYFRNEISSMVRNYRYITSKEVLNYIQNIITAKLTTCALTEKSSYVYTLSIPKSNPAILTSFLATNRPANCQHPQEYEAFVSSVRGQLEIEMTCDRDYARNHSSVLYIDPFHPFILACMNYFSNNSLQYNTFEFALSKQDFRDLEQISAGEYYLGIYRLGITKHIYGAEQTTEMEIPLLYSVEKRKLIEGKEEAYRVMGQSQQNAQMYHSEEPCSAEIIDELRNMFTIEIGDISERSLKDAEMHLESSKQMELNRLNEYYTNRIRQQELLVNELTELQFFEDEESKRRYRTLPMQETNLNNLRIEFEEAKQKVSAGSVQLSMPANLISLNHIFVLP